MPDLVQDIYLMTPPPTYVDTSGAVWEDWSDDGDVDFWRARNYEIFGRIDQARASYERVVALRNHHVEASLEFLQDL